MNVRYAPQTVHLAARKALSALNNAPAAGWVYGVYACVFRHRLEAEIMTLFIQNRSLHRGKSELHSTDIYPVPKS